MNALAPSPSAPPADLEPNTVVLFFGNDWFAENRTSSHHLARQLAKRYKVFYIECPGMRAPRGSGRDIKKAFSKVWKFLRGTRKVEENIHLRTLFQIPFHRYRAVRWLNRRIICATLGWMKLRYGITTPISWFHCPHVSFLVGELGERVSVYYCTDDYAAYPGVHAETVRTMDQDTARRADLVFVTSDTLLAGKLEVNSNTYVSPHGVEFDHFARAQDPNLSLPTDIAHIKGPVIGFFGLIEKFIDLDTINWLAEQRPEWQFLFLGRVAIPTESLPQRANIHFLGKRPYEDLPAYAKRFDACVIPYRQGDWSYHANPLKLREYLATGKPVVAIETPQTSKFADVIEVVSNRKEYLAALDDILGRPCSTEEISKRMSRVAESSWAARAAFVAETIRTTLSEEPVAGAQ